MAEWHTYKQLTYPVSINVILHKATSESGILQNLQNELFLKIKSSHTLRSFRESLYAYMRKDDIKEI